MQVSELIQQLAKVNPEAEVKFQTTELSCHCHHDSGDRCYCPYEEVDYYFQEGLLISKDKQVVYLTGGRD